MVSELNTNYLDKTFIDANTGVYFGYGEMNNMKIKTSQTGFSIIGSISRYYHGSNAIALSYWEFCDAIKKLNSKLNIDLSEGKIFRIDVAENISLNLPVSNYLTQFGNVHYLTRMVFGPYKTLTYSNKRLALSFYDKYAELIKKRKQIPSEFQNKENKILRYELRLKGNPGKQFNLSELRLKHVLNAVFYERLLKLWQEHYFKVEKIRIPLVSPTAFNSVKDFENTFASYGITQFGVDKVESLISSDTCTNKRYKVSRLKQKLRTLISINHISIDNPLILELDQKIRETRIRNEN